MRLKNQPEALAALGVVYCVVLYILGFFFAAGGHGSLLGFVVTAAPISLAPGAVFFFGGFVLWPVIGFFVGSSYRYSRIIFLAVIGGHYLGSLAYFFANFSEEFHYLVLVVAIAPWFLFLWLAVYAAGQVTIWRTYRQTRES